MKIHHDLIQGSEDWFLARIGKATASQASEIITAAKGDLSKSATRYIYSLIADCFSPKDDIPKFETPAMRRGIELEPIAREAFIAETGLPVVEVGIVFADNNVCACSPDGLIPDSNGGWIAGLEIKCPLKGKHVEYVLGGVLPEEYKQQVHWSLAVTGLSQWHFWSFHQNFKPLHVIVQRDDYTAKLEAALSKFVVQYRDAMTAAKPKLQIPPDLLPA